MTMKSSGNKRKKRGVPPSSQTTETSPSNFPAPVASNNPPPETTEHAAKASPETKPVAGQKLDEIAKPIAIAKPAEDKKPEEKKQPEIKTPVAETTNTPEKSKPAAQSAPPLVSVAAALDAIKTEIPAAESKPATAQPAAPVSAGISKPAAPPEIKISEKIPEPKPIEPAATKIAETPVAKSAQASASPIAKAHEPTSAKPEAKPPPVSEKKPAEQIREQPKTAAPPAPKTGFPAAPGINQPVAKPEQFVVSKPIEPPAAKISPPEIVQPKKIEPVEPKKPAESPTQKAAHEPHPSGADQKRTAEAPAPLKPPEKKISEKQVVKDLPVIEPPKPKAEPQPPRAPQPPPRPRIPPMFVVMVTPELAPVAKVGGLADVVFGLARELELRGNAVEIILPKYDCMKYHHIWGLTKCYEHLHVPWFGGSIHTSVYFGFVHGRKCFFIEPHSPDNFFNRGVFYGQNDDVMRFAFFSRAAMEFMLKSGKHPEVIHCHDWQTALVPVLQWEMYQHLGMRHSRVCFTIHNFKHQGVTGEQMLRATGLNRPEYFFHYDRMRDNNNPHALNLMKGGIVYSNFVTTVSPRHAWEAKDGGQGFGLEPTLNTHHYKYGGVLNGLDYDMFNPEKDPHIPAHYNVATIQKKYDNKRALRQRLWLADNEKPIVAFIGRLDPQKGPELVRHAIFYAINNRAQFVLLGESPDKAINDHFWGLKRHLNENPDCHLEIGYSDELAHLIYAGADMMVVPSRYEPCGLTQLISLRYGTVPIVRSVGGLADTVFDKDFSNRPLHERNGYVFHNADNAGIESALHRAIGCYYHFSDHFRHLMINGMNCDYSWNHPGQHYVNIYDYIRDK